MTDLPNTFYRYRSLNTEDERERVRSFLVEGKTFIPAFDQFRQEDESLFTADFTGSEEDIFNFRLRCLRSRHPDKSDSELIRQARLDVRRYQPQSTADNEMYQGVLREQVMHNFGMLCLSSDRDNEVLWKRYGDDHRGIVIGLQMMMSHEYVDEIPLEVHYKDDLPHFELLKDDPSKFVKDVLSTKPTRWEDESEWRLIFSDQPPNQVIQLRAWYPVEIVLGRKISDENKSLVQQWRLECSTPPMIKLAELENEYGEDSDEEVNRPPNTRWPWMQGRLLAAVSGVFGGAFSIIIVLKFFGATFYPCNYPWLVLLIPFAVAWSLNTIGCLWGAWWWGKTRRAIREYLDEVDPRE